MGESGWVNWVTGQNESRVIFKQVKRVAGQTDLSRFALPTQNHVLVISYYLLLDIEKYLIHFCI